MWIKEPNNKLEDSGSQFVNFLFQEGNIFIMDNHLAAGWCWLNKLNIRESYNLFHIDRHYDLLLDEASMQSLIIDADINLSNLSFEQYHELSYPASEFKLFRWDNYIMNINHVYPDFFCEKYFATHNDGNLPVGFITYAPTFIELYGNIQYWLKNKSDRKWIMNLDLDYFFNDFSDNKIHLFSDEYIKEVAREIKKSMKFIDVLTICLSPECCGGWENAIRVNKIICEVLEISFSLDEYKYED